MKKPKIGITTGDINGVGLEIIINTLSDNKINNMCTPIIYGSTKTITMYTKVCKLQELKLRSINNINDINLKSVNVIEIAKSLPRITIGEPSSESGLYSFESLQAASKDLKNNLIDALVTAPVDKHSISVAIKSDFVGQTEYFEDLSNNKESLMLFTYEDLKLGLVTNHISINEIPKKISIKKIVDKTKVLYETLKQDFKIQNPKIAILGLNPHSSDNGLLGNEEEDKIKPAIQELEKYNIIAQGPFSADSFFSKGIYKYFDATLAMYHDQGLIPFKILSEELGVNFTAGLEFVRTSPTHGVAYNIAGQNKADITSFRHAIYTAIDISRTRSEYKELTKKSLPFNTESKYLQSDNDDEITDEE